MQPKDMITLATISAGTLQSRANRAVREYMGASLQPHNISITSWALLGIVAQSQTGIRPSEIAEKLGLKRPMITQLAHELTRRDIIKQISDTSDSRAKRIVLTSHGTAFVTMLEQKLRADMHGFLEGVEIEDLHTYFRVLRIIANKAN